MNPATVGRLALRALDVDRLQSIAHHLGEDGSEEDQRFAKRIDEICDHSELGFLLMEVRTARNDPHVYIRWEDPGRWIVRASNGVVLGAGDSELDALRRALGSIDP